MMYVSTVDAHNKVHITEPLQWSTGLHSSIRATSLRGACSGCGEPYDGTIGRAVGADGNIGNC
jgi:hypothetical protein